MTTKTKAKSSRKTTPPQPPKRRAAKPLSGVRRKDVSSTKTDQWIESGVNQAKLANENNSINVQSIPLDLVILDEKNARKFQVTIDDIKKGPKLPDQPFDDTTQEDFKKMLESHFSEHSNAKKIVQEYFELSLLASSIHECGLIQTIVVYQEDMKFHLISGHRRTLAHHILSTEKINATILSEQPSKIKTRQIQWSENALREDLTLHEQIMYVKGIIIKWEETTNKEMSVRKLMPLLGLKKTKTNNFLKIAKEGCQDLLGAIKSDHITSLEAAADIASKDEDAQRKIISNAIEKNDKIKWSDIKATVRSPDGSVSKKTKPSGVRTPSGCPKTTSSTNLSVIKQIIATCIDHLPLDINILPSNNDTEIQSSWEELYSAIAQMVENKEEKISG